MLLKTNITFIAGLPDFTFDSMKLPFTVEEFVDMLEEELKPADLRLIRKYFLKHDNYNLLHLLENKDAVINLAGNLPREVLLEVISKVKEDIPVKEKGVPPYFEDFIRRWLSEESHQEGARVWEDLLSSLYMDYGIEVKNSLMSGWFELNLNIGNIMTAIFTKIDLMRCNILLVQHQSQNYTEKIQTQEILVLVRNLTTSTFYSVFQRSRYL